MPLITVTYSLPYIFPQREGLRRDIATTVRALSTKILKKDPAVTAVIIQSVEPHDWFCGDQSLAEHKLASFWLDIHVTEGTNSKAEKAAFIDAAFQGMGELLGPLHNETYVHVHDVRGDAYGYGGVTQDYRYIAGTIAAERGKAA